MTQEEWARQCPRLVDKECYKGEGIKIWVKDPPIQHKRKALVLGYVFTLTAFLSALLVVQILFSVGISRETAWYLLCLLSTSFVGARYGIPLVLGRMKIIEYKNEEDVPE